MRTIDDLKTHISNYNNVTVIIGSKVGENYMKCTPEEYNNNMTKKNLKRNNSAFWKFFDENIYHPAEELDINSLIKQLNPKHVINQNIYANYPGAININGYIDDFYCMSCKQHFKYKEQCGCHGVIRPSLLLNKEQYREQVIEDVHSAIIKANTLFLIGVDFKDQILTDMICEFANDKSLLRAEQDTDIKMIATLIDDDYDPNEIFFSEFLVKGNIKESLERFFK